MVKEKKREPESGGVVSAQKILKQAELESANNSKLSKAIDGLPEGSTIMCHHCKLY